MMKLQTSVEITPMDEKSKITYADKILFMGSCFATEVGTIMREYGFDIMLNPFGVLYNPASISSSIERLSTGDLFSEGDVICSQGRYTSFFHHSSFSRDTAEDFLDNANKSLAADSASFSEINTCIVTLGTSWVFRHIKRDIIVSNCHKIVPQEFRRERLSFEDITSMLGEIISSFPCRKWIFTVSPIRHLKDGAHGNQLSKATLLLAIEQLQERFGNVFYFPAYEIMMDELRDYRFYAENMTHPSPQAVRYIFEQFTRYAISESEFAKMALAEKELKAGRHRLL